MTTRPGCRPRTSPQLPGPLGIPRRAGGRLGPRREDDRLRAPVQRRGQLVRPHAELIHRHRDRLEAHRRDQVVRARVPRVLHDDPVARRQPGREHALYPVQRPAHHGQVSRADAVRLQPPRGQLPQPVEHRRRVVEPVRHPDRRQLGQQLRVRPAGDQVARAGRRRQRQPRAHRRPAAHPRAAPAHAGHDPAPVQLTVGRRHRRRADAELARHPPDRGQLVAGRQLAVPHRRLHAGRNFPGAAADREIL